MFLAQHPVGYSAYDASCSKMNLARRTILGGLTDTPHEFEVLDYSFRSSNSGAVRSAFANERRKEKNQQTVNYP